MGTTPAQDEEHLRLLAILHFVVAGIGALSSLIPVVHVVFGIAIVSGAFPSSGRGDSPGTLGWIFIAFAVAVILAGLTFSALLAWAGKCIRERRRRTFCLVMAALACMWFPFGTGLGVFTLVVLLRESVRARFDAPAAPEGP